MMTKDNAELIAEAREEAYAPSLADALDAAEAERDAALLVIAEIRASASECDSNDEFDLLLFAGDTFRILASHAKATS